MVLKFLLSSISPCFSAHTTMTFILITILLILSPLLITNSKDEKDAKELAKDSNNGVNHDQHTAGDNNIIYKNNRKNHSFKPVITTPSSILPSQQQREKK